MIREQFTDAQILSAAGQILVERRKQAKGGRPPKPTACPRCDEVQPSAGEAWKHCRSKCRIASCLNRVHNPGDTCRYCRAVLARTK